MKTLEVPSEPAGAFASPLVCDSDGNLYISTGSASVRTIRKFTASGKRLAVFETTPQPDVKPLIVGYFSVAQNGELYQYILSSTEIATYIFVYRADGTLKSKIKTQPGFGWSPAQLAVFSSGQILVTGQKDRRDFSAPKLPFTGILAADGSLLKEINLEDDEDLTNKVSSADPQVFSPTNPTSSRAIAWGAMELGADGNVYVMRAVSPAIVYAINAGGAVVRRFTIDPGKPNYRPSAMHVTKSRIAVLFWHPEQRLGTIKVTDLEGNVVATYNEVPGEGEPALGAALACYSQDPEQFTFLKTIKGKLAMVLVEAQ